MLNYSKKFSRGTLSIDNDLIAMKVYDSVIELKGNELNPHLTLLTINQFLPGLINSIRDQLNGITNDLFNKKIYNDYINHVVGQILETPVNDENKFNLPFISQGNYDSLVSDMKSFIKDNYLKSLFDTLLERDELQCSLFESVITPRLMVNYGIIDLTNVVDTVPKTDLSDFNKLSEMIINDFLSDNIKKVFNEYEADNVIDSLGIFSPSTPIIGGSSLFEVYNNEVLYATMKYRDLTNANYKDIGLYTNAISSVLSKYIHLIFNKELTKVENTIRNKINVYSDFISNCWNFIDELTFNQGWEFHLIDNIENLIQNREKNCNYNILNTIINKNNILTFMNESIDTFIKTYSVKDFNEKIMKSGIITDTYKSGYNANINSAKNNKRSIDSISRAIILSAYEKYSGEAI